MIVDPSHGTGLRAKVSPMALAAVAAGADGITVEVHTDPDRALSDGPQSLYPEQFEKLMRDIEALAPVLGKELARLPEVESAHAPRSHRRARAEAPGSIVVAFQGERGAYSEHAIRHWFSREVQALPAAGVLAPSSTPCSRARRASAWCPSRTPSPDPSMRTTTCCCSTPTSGSSASRRSGSSTTSSRAADARIEDIRRVFSHPQGLAQCGRFLDAAPGWERVAFYDTAGSVRHVAELEREGERGHRQRGGGPCLRSFGSEAGHRDECAELHAILRDCARGAGAAAGSRRERPGKASLCFAVADEPGALFKALQVLADRGLNMKKLESRPIHGKPWEYLFYVDVDIPADAALFSQCMEELKAVTEDLRVLGTYRG